MAKFSNIVDCPPEDTTFFSGMKQDSNSYSKDWYTATKPDNDFESNLPVYAQVLASCNIGIDSINDLPTRGTLPGMDINRMSSIDAINLSLAESLLDGEWWEVVEDGLGGVFFQKVYDNGLPGKTITLNPRLCIPSTEKRNSVDMVAVTGYDRPPQRYVKDFKVAIDDNPGIVNPESLPETGQFTVDFAAMTAGTCHEFLLRTEAIKVYPDPLIDAQSFGGQEENPFYDVKAYESIIGWAHRSTGMDTNNENAAKDELPELYSRNLIMQPGKGSRPGDRPERGFDTAQKNHQQKIERTRYGHFIRKYASL